MKVPKSVLKAVAVAVVVSTTASACVVKVPSKPLEKVQKKRTKNLISDCAGCGMG